jgi:predicted MPP superfamily phosphohydrolase
MERIVRLVNKEAPDLVAITGDLVDGLFFDRSKDIEPLSKLKAKDAVVACTGNHEYYWDFPSWEAFYAGIGLEFLRNEAKMIRRADSAIAVCGVDDVTFGYDAKKVKSEIDHGAFTVMLFHSPYRIRKVSPVIRPHLVLSGHTHGGVMPVLSHYIAKMNGGFVRGLYKNKDGSIIHVSPGTGQWAGFPIRFFNPSEITLLTLRVNRLPAAK